MRKYIRTDTRKDVVYEVECDSTELGKYIEVSLYDDGLLRIYWSSDAHAVSYYFILRDKDDYENFRDELIAVFQDCEDINEAYYELENYLNSGEADEFVEEYHRC